MDDVKTFILFSALFKYNNTGLHNCIDTIKDMFCIKPGYSIHADEYVPTVTIINKFINENETYYDVKNVIEAAIKNSDIDIEKLCESLNL